MKKFLIFCSIFCCCSAMGMKKALTKADLTKQSPELIVKLDNKKRYGYRKDHLTKHVLLNRVATMIAINGLYLKSAKGGGGFGMSGKEIQLMGHTEKQYCVTLKNNQLLQGELIS